MVKTNIPESVSILIATYEDLKWNERNGLNGGGEYLIVRGWQNPSISPPDNIPYIVPATGDEIYFVIPVDEEFQEEMKYLIKTSMPASVIEDGSSGFVPEAEFWPGNDEIIKTIEDHNSLAIQANRERDAKKQLESDSNLFVGAYNVPDTEPMLIDGLMRERGVSVIYGPFDEFKTTLVLDMMTHVSVGASWQGRKVKPRPVQWYALEGEDELPKRVQALETRIGPNTAWGEGHAPIKVRDRIPDTGEEWRREISKTNFQFTEHIKARETLGMFELKRQNGFTRGPDGSKIPHMEPEYPTFIPDEGNDAPIIVVDTLSLALGEEDEKGPRAAGFINDCLDLLKDRPDLAPPGFLFEGSDSTQLEQWYKEKGDIDFAVASHVIIIHHQTKTGIDFAGHRAIAANSQALYRVHRTGKMTDANRPYSGVLTPQRVKGIPRPAPVRFDVEVVKVEGTNQTAAILKDKAKAIPKKLEPIIEVLREHDDHEAISSKELNVYLDTVTGDKATKEAKRAARKRNRDSLITHGILEPLSDDDGGVDGYRFCYLAAA